jgi:hypothetical protein
MKKTALILPLLLLTCSPFSTRYDRIEPDTIRPITVVFDTHGAYPDGAPGDTVRARAYFAGDSASSVSWSVSWDVVTDAYGTDTFLNTAALPVLNMTSALPDSQVFNFMVPDSVFFTTVAIPNQLVAAVRDSLPSGMRSMTKNQMAAFLGDFAKVNILDASSLSAFMSAWGTAVGGSFDTALSAAAKLVGLFSIKAYVFADITSKDGKHLREKIDFVARYNSKFAGIPGMSSLLGINTNPRIRWLGVYIVRTSSTRLFSPFDSAFSGAWTLQYLYNEPYPDSVRDTLVIDTGCSYYLAADSGMVAIDRNGTVVIDTSRDGYLTYKRECITAKSDTVVAYSFNGVPASVTIPKDSTRCIVEDGGVTLETFYYDWFYENLALDSVSLPLDSLLVLGMGGGTSMVSMLPSMDTHMTYAHFRVVTYDYFIGQYNRPEGQCFRDAYCHFKYTDAYKNGKSRY